MTFSEDEIREMVRRVLLRTLGPDGIQATPDSSKAHAALQISRPSITESDVLDVPAGGTLTVSAGTLITPLARDTALERRVEIIREPGVVLAPLTSDTAGTSSQRSEQTVALGADHGGYTMKEDLKGLVGELGYRVIDCGTHSNDSVDYPDLAYAVAQLVSDGRAWRGIIVDGAGIGSCMAANKVPGVRAAMCYDHATAVNSREHNDANVLTLGGVLVGSNLARQIVRTWLQTGFGGGRHGRRVDKIMNIEQRFLRAATRR
jgi:ribose 5-phosphate isomerase B